MLRNWINLVIMHLCPTSTIFGVILSRQNVLNEISSLVNNIKASARDKRFRICCKYIRPCPSKPSIPELHDIFVRRNITFFNLLDFCLLYGGIGCVTINNYMYLPYLLLSKLLTIFSPISDKRSEHQSI